MKRQFWRSWTFRRLFICYIVLLFISVLSSSAFYSYYERVYNRKMNEASQLAIEQTAGVLDERLEAVLNISNTISVSSVGPKIRSFALPFTAYKYFTLHKSASFLNTFTVLSSLVEQTYIYCSQLDCILDSGHIYTDLNQLDNVIRQRIGMSREAFMQNMTFPHQNQFLLTEAGTILCLQTLDMMESRPNLTLILVLNTSFFQSVLNETEHNAEGSAWMIVPENLTLGNPSRPPVDYKSLTAANQSLATKDGNTIVLSAPSSCSSFHYVLAVPMSVFMREANSIRLIFTFSTITVLLVGLLLSYLMASRNYRPIYALRQIAEVTSQEKNDLTAIQEKISQVLASEQAMNKQIDVLNNIASHQTFHALVTGNTDYIREHPNAGLNIEFHGNLFISSLIELEEIPDQKPIVGLDRSGELNVLIDEILVRLCRDLCQYVIRRDEQTFYVIFCFEKDEETNPIDMQTLAVMEKLLPMLRSDLSMDAYIFIGDVQHGLENVHLSCKKAIQAREYTDFIGETNKRIILYDPSMYSISIPNDNYDIMDAERRFAGLLLSGDYEQAKSILYQILAYYRCKDGISLYIMRCRMFGLMNTMLNAMNELEPDLPADFYKECRPIERILSAKNMHELESVLFDIVDSLIGRQEQHSNDAQEKIHQIVGYVKAHYYDSNLGVQMIADEFGLSLPYLSRIFKENMRVGLLNYINQYRVDKAKQILAEEEGINLSDLAQRVGYASSQTLIRIFKRHDGVTPGNYRASMISSGEKAIKQQEEENT